MSSCNRAILPQAIERIKQELAREDPAKQVTLEYMQLDLSSFQSTKDFVSAFKGRNLPLDILINNAGIAWVPFCKYRTLEHYVRQLYACMGLDQHTDTVTLASYPRHTHQWVWLGYEATVT